MNQVSTYAQQLQALVVLYLPRVLMAGVALVVGWWLIGWASRIIAAAATRLDVSLASFLTSLVNIVLKVLLLISVAGMVGFETTSFVAILGAAGLAVGLALQGTLANFAGGVLILIFKPYVVGDTIESQGKSGEVKEIQIFNTILVTPQGDTIILPNGATSNNVIINKTAQNKALVEIVADLDNATDLAALRAWAIPLLQADEDVLPAPAPQVAVTALKPGGMTVAFRAYTPAGRNGSAQARLIEQLQRALAQQGVGSPVPVQHSYVRTLPE
ncbi:mechanosensitive ion channel family protein [Hymenobacter negativus]|uniref:Mechanosensitive ion channel family protein n=1 Tax=Hymenobacter negativus TaxID=2795026 RepID=A0ABS0Q4L3_9BACT|nr:MULTISPECIES: mechanosensitive ion channel family protein [Bacteria]MBH8557611.1 mechanosensitive ion channel family protein [Hymenobacter negativus]MBH8567859.1 mechanosensitive ion channel family protein [Hymenobacter negativus]MBR7207595.1 mechanosensitive ion channel family protein [Microvirga sp. STS02]